MTGNRRTDLADDEWYKLAPGEYMRTSRGHWYCRTPTNASFPKGACGNLTRHEVVEHEDGTITVSPSILVTGGGEWHGWLQRGVWREA